MYVAQHADAPKRRSTTANSAGRHRRSAQAGAITSVGLPGGTMRISKTISSGISGQRIASGVSAVAVGAAGFVAMSAPAHADGETLNMKEIAGVVKETGLPCVTGTAVAQAESGGDTGIRSRFPGEDSRGLFQINEAHGFDFNWDDALANAKMAKDIYDSAGGWSPWGAYTNGSYSQYLDDARGACADATQVSTASDSDESDGANAQPAAQQQEKEYTGKHRKNKSGSTYKVLRGDTLSEIAQERATTWQHLMEMNPQVEDPGQIFPGDKIDVTGHPVQ